MKCNTANIHENMHSFLEEAERIKTFYMIQIMQFLLKVLKNRTCYLGLSPPAAKKGPLKQLSGIQF